MIVVDPSSYASVQSALSLLSVIHSKVSIIPFVIRIITVYQIYIMRRRTLSHSPYTLKTLCISIFFSLALFTDSYPFTKLSLPRLHFIFLIIHRIAHNGLRSYIYKLF